MFKVLRGGVAAAILACLLSVGLAVQPAAAYVVSPVPVPPAVVGALPAAATGAVSAGAACVASVVCLGVVGVAAAAVGLYATRDSWVPALDRLLGPDINESDTVTSAPGVQLRTSQAVTMAEVVGSELRVTATDTATGFYDSSGTSFQYDVMCRTPGGSFTWSTGTMNIGYYMYPWTQTRALDCGAGNVPVGLLTRPAAPGAPFPSPSQYLRWGATDFPASDALNVYRATAKCVLADGSTQDLVVEYQGQEGEDVGFLIPSCFKAGLGDHAKSVDVDVQLPGRTDFRDVWSVTPTADPLYPDCDPTAAAGCVLAVHVDGEACVVGDTDCAAWTELPSSRVSCHWGPYAVGVGSCYLLERAYQTGGVTITEDNVDGDPATGTAPAPVPTPSAPGSFPTAVPLPTPTAPAPTGAPLPPVVGETGTGGSDCWDATVASWNPVDWVLTPVKCALVWAFVPPGGLEPRLSEFGDAWGGSDIGTWVGTLSAPMTDISGAFSGGGSGCGGPEWTLSLSMFGGGSYPFRPFDSCREPLASVAPIVKAVATALVLVIGFRAVANPMLGAMGLPRIPGRASLRRDEVVSGGH